jgi:hypothetical protein
MLTGKIVFDGGAIVAACTKKTTTALLTSSPVYDTVGRMGTGSSLSSKYQLGNLAAKFELGCQV